MIPAHRRPSAPVEAPPSGEPTLAHHLVSEYLATAEMVAMVASYVFGQASGRAVIFAGPITFLLPHPATIFPAVAQGLVDSPLSHDLEHRLAAFYAAALRATALTAIACHDPHEASIPVLKDWTELAHLWRKVAAAGRSVARAFMDASPLVIARSATAFSDDAAYRRFAVVQSTMAVLETGAATNIADDGFLFLAGLFDRRREPRVGRSDAIEISKGNITERAQLSDASRQGFGIVGVTHVVARMPVTLSIRGREKLRGIVMWRNADRAGVRLIQPLAPADPLLRPDPRLSTP